MAKHEISTEFAQRSPKGIPYTDGQKHTGVDYKTPPNVVPREDEQVYSILTPDGREIPDSVPMEPPLGYSSGPSLADFVQRMIHGELSRAAAEQEMETFEEAEDFEIEDDPIDPLTPYEEVFLPKPPAAHPASQAAEGRGAGEGVSSPKTDTPAPAPNTPPSETPAQQNVKFSSREPPLEGGRAKAGGCLTSSPTLLRHTCRDLKMKTISQTAF